MQISFKKEETSVEKVHQLLVDFFSKEDEADENALIVAHELIINSYRLSEPHYLIEILVKKFFDRYEIIVSDRNGGIENIHIQEIKPFDLTENGRGLSMVMLLASDFKAWSEGGTFKYFVKIRR